MVPIIHYPAVVAGRGRAGFPHLVAVTCGTTPCDFDGLLDAMPAILAGAWKAFTEMLAARGEVPAEPSQSIVVVGWSPREDRFIGREYQQENVAIGFGCQDVGRYHVAPWAEDMEHARLDPRSPGLMAELARAQTRMVARTKPEASAGGDFIVCTLRRRGITTETICNLNGVRGREDLLTGRPSRAQGVGRILIALP